MPRTLDGTELWKKLDDLSVYRIVATTPGDTTAVPAITVGMNTISLAATTNFTAADPIGIIGSGGMELNAITTLAASIVTTYKAAFAQNAGARVVEMVRTQLGHIEEGGISMDPSQDLTPINSAISSIPVAYITGIGEIKFSFGLLGFNGPNFQTAFGITEAETGAGSAADPYQTGLGGLSMGSQGIQCFRALGTRQDGKSVQVDFNDVRVVPTGGIRMNRKEAAVIPCQASCTSMVIRIYT